MRSYIIPTEERNWLFYSWTTRVQSYELPLLRPWKCTCLGNLFRGRCLGWCSRCIQVPQSNHIRGFSQSYERICIGIYHTGYGRHLVLGAVSCNFCGYGVDVLGVSESVINVFVRCAPCFATAWGGCHKKAPLHSSNNHFKCRSHEKYHSAA